jgi:hypothetical protein
LKPQLPSANAGVTDDKVAAAIATPISTVLSDLRIFMVAPVEARLWSIAMPLVRQASVTEIDYDTVTVHVLRGKSVLE